jgi:hypothetical protein
MSKRKLDVQTPGETVQEPEALDAVAAVGLATEPSPEDSAAATPAPEGPVMQPLPPPSAPALTADAAKDQALARNVEATAHLIGSSDALDWSHLTSGALIEAKINPNKPDLPHDWEIDPSRLPYGTSRLTHEGWVVSTAPEPKARR